MVRTPCCDRNGLRKGTWTPEEDEKLIAYVTRYGCWNWRQLPKYAGLARCGKSCRLRWMNYLRPDLKRGNYSQEEEDLIIKLHKSLGNRWSAIAAHLPGRTDNEVKNHWHTYLKKRSKQASVSREREQEQELSPSDMSQQGSTDQEMALKNETSPLHPETHQILESSLFSPQASCTTTIPRSMSFAIEDDDSFQAEIFEETSGNFWTEPFLPENYYTNDHFLPQLVDPGLLSSPSPIMGEEFLCMYGLCDEHILFGPSQNYAENLAIGHA